MRRFMLIPGLLVAGAALIANATHAADPLPIFDAHLHYSHDAWETVSPKEVIGLLRKGGVRRAMVSSSNDDGTQALYKEAPDLIIPELRPYRSRGEVSTWFRSDTMVAHLEDRLKRYQYVAIGEFHLYPEGGAALFDALFPEVLTRVMCGCCFGLVHLQRRQWWQQLQQRLRRQRACRWCVA